MLINGTTVTVTRWRMSGCATAACCSCGLIRARPRRWCSTRTIAPSLCSRGTCTRGIYYNMKTAVETVFIGKDRQFNRRFLANVWPLPGRANGLHAGFGLGKGAGREPGRSGARALLHTTATGGELYEELNAWLLDRCVAYAKAHKHPELTDCTIWQAFEAERPQLVQITRAIRWVHATQASVTKTTQHTLMVAVARGEMPYGQFVQEDTLIGIRTAAVDTALTQEAGVIGSHLNSPLEEGGFELVVPL